MRAEGVRMRGMGEVLVHFDGVLLVHPSGVPASMRSKHGLLAALSLLLKLFLLQPTPGTVCTVRYPYQPCFKSSPVAAMHIAAAERERLKLCPMRQNCIIIVVVH